MLGVSEPKRITRQLVEVLRVFTENPDRFLTVHRIALAIKRSKPTVTGVLARCEKADWLLPAWQERPTPARPVRVYRLSHLGASRAQEILTAWREPR